MISKMNLRVWHSATFITVFEVESCCCLDYKLWLLSTKMRAGLNEDRYGRDDINKLQKRQDSGAEKVFKLKRSK
jgi:hypothetical protein